MNYEGKLMFALVIIRSVLKYYNKIFNLKTYYLNTLSKKYYPDSLRVKITQIVHIAKRRVYLYQ